jgi:hypothetical protein
MGFLTLPEFEPLFARYGISSRISSTILQQVSKNRVR